MKNILFPFLFLISSVCHAQWQQGDGPGGGSITSIFTNGSKLYVGTAEGALYKSDPDGTNRTMLLHSGTYVGLNEIITLGNRIYIDYYMPLGPLYSDDDGLTWVNDTTIDRPIGFRDGIFFRNTSFSLDSGITWINYSLFGVGGELFRFNNETYFRVFDKLFRTLNNGQTWDTLLITPVSGNIIKSGSNYISTSGELSIDSGLTWNTISTFSNKVIKQIEHDNFSVYALTDTSGLFFSQDNGISWSQITSGIPSNHNINFMRTDGEFVYVTGLREGVFVSSDHGITWSSSNHYLNSLTTYVIAEKNSVLFAATTSGVFRSTDAGLSWVKLNISPNANSTIFKDIFIDNGNIFAVCHKEVFKSIDNGNTWTRLNLDTFSRNQFCMAANDSLLFLSGENGLYISYDQGNSWLLRSTEYSFAFNTIAVLNQNVFLSQWDSLAISNDNGISWRKSQGINGPIMRVTEHDDKIYVCDQTNGILSSSDSGLSWTNILNRMALSNIYVTDSIIWAPHLLRIIYYSFDGGLTFDSVNTPDHFFGPNGFALNSGYILAGMEAGGIWRTPYINPINTTSELVDEPLTLFPNPAVNSITVKDRAELFVYVISDLLGRRIKKGISFGTIDISFLKAGEYYLSTYDNSGPAVKFIKQN